MADMTSFLECSRFARSVPGAFIQFSCEGDWDIRCLNDRAAALFGCDSPEDFVNRLGKDLKPLLPEESIAALVPFTDAGESEERRTAFSICGKNGTVSVEAVVMGNAAEGTCSLVLRNMTSDARHARQDLEIIQILASEYSSVYYIDLVTDGLTPYTMNAETESEFGRIFNTGISYSEAFRLYVDRLIYPDDKDMMLHAGSIKNIVRELRDKKTFLTTYRSADNKYSEMKFVKVGGDADEPTAVALGFAEKDEQLRREQQMEEERQRNYDIIQILASEYSSVYYIDLATDGLTPYSMNAETESEFGRIFNTGISYSEAFRLYVDRLIYPDDKDMMLRAGSIENIARELRDKKTFLTTYRSADNKYSEMKFVKVGGDADEPIAVALGFAEKDEQLRREQQIEEERQRNYDIIQILASEYSSVYYIDLRTDALDPYSMNEDTESAFGKIFRSGIRYSEAYRLYVDQLILPADKPMMIKAGSIGNIMKELRSKKTFITTYRNMEGHYSEMKFVKVGNEEGLPVAVALGFADKDAELRAKNEEQRKLRRNIDIIEILASEYSSVYYIDLTTDELDPYTMNAETENEFGSIFRSGIFYSNAFRMYVDSLVYAPDREMMLKAGSVYNILKELSTKKTFITTYRSDNNGNPHYCEMKFVKVGDDENPQSVALGFADKDEEIRADMKRREIAERDQAVISGLSDDFGCVVYVGFEDGSEVHYRFDPYFDQHIAGWSKINNFKERLAQLLTIVHPDDRDMFAVSTTREVVRENVIKSGVWFVNFRTIVGDKITYFQAKFVRDENHPDTHVIAGFHNVDADTRREMEALEAAEKANRAKTDFLFNMSHDIRTPMNAVIGFTNMAKKYADDREKLLDCLNKTQSASNLLLALINSILEMSRIESGKATVEENKADMRNTFKEIEDTMKELAAPKKIDLTFELGAIQDRYVYCDITRCTRVFVNITTNAIKYTPEGGQVRVKCEQIGYRSGQGIYRYTFADNGIGMSEEFQQHVFEQFMRESNTVLSGVQGTGLGLSVCKSFVTLMNGTIDVKSKKGVGTTFIVTLPFKTRAADESDLVAGNNSVIEEDIALFRGKRVLLAEDNELNRIIAHDILEEKGLIVTDAENGQVAVNLLITKGPDAFDLILMDIQMPVMNGYEATRTIRDAFPDQHIPIIALSANAFEEDRAASFSAGMDGHIAKPIDPAALLEEIRGML